MFHTGPSVILRHCSFNTGTESVFFDKFRFLLDGSATRQAQGLFIVTQVVTPTAGLYRTLVDERASGTGLGGKYGTESVLLVFGLQGSVPLWAGNRLPVIGKAEITKVVLTLGGGTHARRHHFDSQFLGLFAIVVTLEPEIAGL